MDPPIAVGSLSSAAACISGIEFVEHSDLRSHQL